MISRTHDASTHYSHICMHQSVKWQCQDKGQSYLVLALILLAVHCFVFCTNLLNIAGLNMSEVSSARAPEKKKNRLLMSCRKCGYRFLWELKDREEGQNHCPCCFAARPWDDKPWEAPTGQDIQRWYYNQKSDPSIKRRKYDKLSTSLDIGYRAGTPSLSQPNFCPFGTI